MVFYPLRDEIKKDGWLMTVDMKTTEILQFSSDDNVYLMGGNEDYVLVVEKDKNTKYLIPLKSISHIKIERRSKYGAI